MSASHVSGARERFLRGVAKNISMSIVAHGFNCCRVVFSRVWVPGVVPSLPPPRGRGYIQDAHAILLPQKFRAFR